MITRCSRLFLTILFVMSLSVLMNGYTPIAQAATKSAPRSLSAVTPFLTLPFPGEPNTSTGDSQMNVQQGWVYSYGGLHKGIDYIEGTIDDSSTWQHSPIVAAADGEACADTDGDSGGCVQGLGNRVLIKHDLGNGLILYSYYGHLNWIAPWIPIGNRNNTVHVTRGSQIGTSGDTGTTKGWIHLHFGVTLPDFSWLDPYDLYTTRDKYPDPNGTNGLTAGTNNYWINNPPTYAPGLGVNYGGVDNLDGYCQSLGNARASLDGSTAYDWHCVDQSGNRTGINMADACDWQYSSSYFTALTKDYYNPYSWRCYNAGI